MAQTKLDDRPLTMEAMAAHLAKGCKPAEQWRVGAEHEKFAFRLGTNGAIDYLPDAEGRGGILALMTGLMRSPIAWRSTVSVCTHTPSTQSTTTSPPSVTRRAAVTSEEKSTCPGESMRLIR